LSTKGSILLGLGLFYLCGAFIGINVIPDRIAVPVQKLIPAAIRGVAFAQGSMIFNAFCVSSRDVQGSDQY
jgi:hypothetical protein